MHPLAGRRVIKMNGLGNVIIILDLRDLDAREAPSALDAAAARAIGNGERLGFDQLMALTAPHDARSAAFVHIYNADGSLAEACGNGTRCVAWYLMRETPGESLSLETSAGLLECWRRGETRFAVDMGAPRFAWAEIPLRDPVPDTGAIPFAMMEGAPPLTGAVVNMGNPHVVFFVDDLTVFDLAAIGPRLEHHVLFPERANISLAQIVSERHILAQVWERGAGLTQACGSAACAVLVAAARRSLAAREALVTLPGGDLSVRWRDDDHVIMEGPVEWEFETMLDAALFADVPA